MKVAPASVLVAGATTGEFLVLALRTYGPAAKEEVCHRPLQATYIGGEVGVRMVFDDDQKTASSSSSPPSDTAARWLPPQAPTKPGKVPSTPQEPPPQRRSGIVCRQIGQRFTRPNHEHRTVAKTADTEGQLQELPE